MTTARRPRQVAGPLLAVALLAWTLAMPGWVRHLAPASPGYWAVSALHAALGGDAAGTFRASAVLAAVAVVCGAVAAVRMGRGAARSASL